MLRPCQLMIDVAYFKEVDLVGRKRLNPACKQTGTHIMFQILQRVAQEM